MKKVRKEDVEKLIFLYYKEFIEMLTEEEFEDSIHVDINSVFIQLIDLRDFKDEDQKENRMVNFAKQLKKVTFGKLKVTYMGAKKDGNECSSWMYIANAYEVIEDEYEEEDKDDCSGFGVHFECIGN